MKPVKSSNEGVRGVWSSVHGGMGVNLGDDGKSVWRSGQKEQ